MKIDNGWDKLSDAELRGVVYALNLVRSRLGTRISARGSMMIDEMYQELCDLNMERADLGFDPDNSVQVRLLEVGAG